MRPVITLFTRPGCTLCDSAKFVIKKAGRRVRLHRCLSECSELSCLVLIGESLLQATFDYREVDISATGQQKWLELYTNDIPVIHLGDKEV
jgi:glutaredoxin